MLMSLLLTLPITNWLYKKCARIRGIDTEAAPVVEMAAENEEITAVKQEGGTEE